MAQLIGGVVGAVLGSFVGAPQIGFMVGSMIGGAVDRAMNPVVTEGPRIGDLNVSSSAYGNPKPILYGTARLPGQIIWTDGIKETRVVKKSKGKGGQPTKQVSYLYSASVACGLCEGPVSGFIRIWMDGKLVYDRDGTGVLTNNRFTLRTYLGTENQLPDGLITQNVGANASPAYRGLAYIVLEELQLEPFGNRIPSITVEVTNNITTVDYKQNVTFSTTVPNQGVNSTRIDRYRDLIVKLSFTRSGASAGPRANQLVSVFDMDGKLLISKSVEEIFTGTLANQEFGVYFNDPGCLVIPGECLYLMTRDSSFVVSLHRLDINTLEILETLTSRSALNMLASDVSLPGGFPYMPRFSGFQLVFDELGEMTPFMGLAQYPANNGTYCTVRLGKFMKIVDGHSRYFNGVNESTNVPGFDPAPNIAGLNNAVHFIPGKIDIGYSEAYWISFDNGQGFGINNDLAIKKMKLTKIGAFDVPTLTNTNQNSAWQILLGSQLSTAFGSAINVFILGACYDPNDDTLIFLASANSTPTYLFKYDFATNAIIWVRQIPGYSSSPWIRYEAHWSESDVSLGTVGLPNFAGFAVDTATGNIVYNTVATPTARHSAAIWDSKMFGGYGIATQSTFLFEKFYFNRATSGTVTLKTIVDDLCRRGGLNPATQVDTTALNAINVKGYVVARPTTAKATLDQLSSAFFIKSVESDGKLKFYLKSSASSVVTIPQRWLASDSQDDGNFWEETRRQELELPKKITVTFINPEDDYQQGAQFQQRITNPYPSSWGNSELTIEMPMVLYPIEAKNIATNMLYTAWSERVSYKSILPWRYVALDPTDTVVVSMDDGENFGVRISSTNLGANYHIEANFVSQDASTYTAPSIYNAGGSLGFVPQEIITLEKSRIVFLDIPLITDQDEILDTSSTRVYFGSSPYKSRWAGGSLDISIDNGTSFNFLEDILDPIQAGIALTILPVPIDPNVIDYTTQLKVIMNRPEFDLESISTELFLAGQNVALVGREIIYFKDAVLELDGSYTLSNIMRGRRGTEWACNLHTSSEEFFLLPSDDNSVLRTKLPVNTVNIENVYRLTTYGMYASEGMVNSFTFTGAAERPYSPVDIARLNTTTGTTISWKRRNRMTSSFRSGLEIPTSELPETYDIYILSAPYNIVTSNTKAPTTFVRKYTSTTTSVNYTLADMTTDGFNRFTNTLNVVIFQKSPRVGDGFPGFASLAPS